MHVQSNPFLVSLNSLTFIPNWIIDRNKSAVKTLSLSVCTNITENIDPLLLTSTAMPGILDQATIHDFIDGDDSISINKEKRHLSEVEFSVKGEAVIQSTCQ
jgi:hypothetical protein